MFRTSLFTIGVLVAFATPVLAQENLKAAIVAALGKAIEDSIYADVLAKYGLSAPNLSELSLVKSKDHPFPNLE